MAARSGVETEERGDAGGEIAEGSEVGIALTFGSVYLGCEVFVA